MHSVVLLFLLFAGLLLCLDWLTRKLRGDCRLVFQAEKIRNAFSKKGEQELQLQFELPLENQSQKEQALLLYFYAQPVPKDKEDKEAETWTRVTIATSPRQDGYFEAVMVKPGKSVFLQFSLLTRGEKSVANILRKKELTLQVSYAYYGRTPLRTEHRRFSISLDQFAENPGLRSTAQKAIPKASGNASVIPVYTPIIVPGTNLSQWILQHAKSTLSPGDWVVLAESAVAVAQGRVHPASGIKPGFFARRLNRFFAFDSSLASCYSLELAIREVGLPRILAGIVAGSLGRLLGRKGDFYRIAGKKASTIDDSAGTLPPFDKSVVLGPEHPNQTAEEIKQNTGFEAAIVDANDLQKVDVLGKSSGIAEEEVIQALRENPQGNSDEQTPIVILKRGLNRR